MKEYFPDVFSGSPVEVDVVVMVIDFWSVCRMCLVGDSFVPEMIGVWIDVTLCLVL